jgi:NAD-dependent dihydropyrimidine dehydrogenase PreA subunit
MMNKNLSYHMLQIGGVPAGLVGLDELLSDLYDQGLCPDDPNLPQKLIAGVRVHNYIPRIAVDAYRAALLQAFRHFYSQKSGDDDYQIRSYGTWRGYPRETISWFPTIAEELCIRCDRCLEFCSYGVYEKQADGKVVVAEPFLCRVGCHSCAAVCDPEAILFPPNEMLNDYRPKG